MSKSADFGVGRGSGKANPSRIVAFDNNNNSQMGATATSTISWPNPGPFTLISGNSWQLTSNATVQNGFNIPAGITAYITPLGSLSMNNNNGGIKIYGTLVGLINNTAQPNKLAGLFQGGISGSGTYSLCNVSSNGPYSSVPSISNCALQFPI